MTTKSSASSRARISSSSSRPSVTTTQNSNCETGAPAPGRRPTRLIVDTGVIEQNARIIAQRLSSGSRFMAVVKANGYGHGALECARAALRGGATNLGVATVAEALELRDAGLDEPILVLGSSDPTEAPIANWKDVAIGVGDRVQVERLLESLAAAQPDRPL